MSPTSSSFAWASAILLWTCGISTASAAIARVSTAVAVTGGDALSVTATVKLSVPAVVGVPDIMPSAARVMPSGSIPALTLQLSGAVPPLAASCCG